MNRLTIAQEELMAELQEVQQQLVGSVDALGMPLSELVRARIPYVLPLVRAALILTVALGHPDPPLQRHRRILLATSLETLYLGLHVHNLLVTASVLKDDDREEIEPTNRSFVGSSILAGDYLCSRSAQLAAQTDNPVVVEIFAQALQNVSEAHLRQLFNTAGGPFSENGELLRAAALAAVELTDLSPIDRESVMSLGLNLAKQNFSHLPANFMPSMLNNLDLSQSQIERWQAFQSWLNNLYLNGHAA